MVLSVVAVAAMGEAAQAARTFYIDYTEGADTNSGEKATPWKRHPYMQGFAGQYEAQPGDTFVFKGGVTWPGECFGLVIRQGGTPEAPTVYTVDKTWHVGATWSRPVFDMERKKIVENRPVYFADASNVVFEGFEIKNQRIWGSNCWSWGGISVTGSTNITVRNCHIHSWYVAEPTVTADHEFGGVFSASSTGTVVEGCEIHGGEVDGFAGKYSGTGIRNAGITRNCTVYDVPNGLLGGGTVDGCEFHHIYTSYDSDDNVVTPPNGRHANGVYLFGEAVFRNNYIHDVLAPGAPILFPAAGWNKANATALIYNNVIRGNIHINGDGAAPGNQATWHIYNNTIGGGSTNNAIVASRKNDNALGHVFIRNNIMVTPGSYPAGVNLGQPVADLVIDNNVYYAPSPTNRVSGEPCVLQLSWLTPSRYNLAGSQALGYNGQSFLSPVALDVDYEPSSASDPGVDRGVNLSAFLTTDKNGAPRPQGSAFDIGAYEYQPPVVTVLGWSVRLQHGATAVATEASDGYVEPRRDGLRTVAFACSAALDPATISTAAVALTNGQGTDLSARIQSVTLSEPHIARVVLDGPLPDGATYTFSVRETVRGVGDKPLAGAMVVRLVARCGDVDSDGAVTEKDIQLIREAAGAASLPSLSRHDVDCSGEITAADMLLVRQQLPPAAP
ncbi:MAG: hypothetical protein GXY74_13490 [Phycisphaerae bacterium]|nr:hypothetical protein [Phycisphaerae bacterium]